jgi:hypothetical protein
VSEKQTILDHQELLVVVLFATLQTVLSITVFVSLHDPFFVKLQQILHSKLKSTVSELLAPIAEKVTFFTQKKDN